MAPFLSPFHVPEKSYPPPRILSFEIGGAKGEPSPPVVRSMCNVCDGITPICSWKAASSVENLMLTLRAMLSPGAEEPNQTWQPQSRRAQRKATIQSSFGDALGGQRGRPRRAPDAVGHCKTRYDQSARAREPGTRSLGNPGPKLTSTRKSARMPSDHHLEANAPRAPTLEWTELSGMMGSKAEWLFLAL